MNEKTVKISAKLAKTNRVYGNQNLKTSSVCRDFKGKDGLWVKSYSPEPNTRYRTRASKLWNDVERRASDTSSHRRNNPTYAGTCNGFKDFQEFAEWCQHQYGYMNKEENGRFWHLDKDLKGFENKMYAPSTCLFVPQRVNNLLTSNNTLRGSNPIGVSWDAPTKKYVSRCSDGKGTNIFLGRFTSAMSAHEAWQKCKVELIRYMCNNDIEIVGHVQLVQALLAQAKRIEDDLLNNIETK